MAASDSNVDFAESSPEFEFERDLRSGLKVTSPTIDASVLSPYPRPQPLSYDNVTPAPTEPSLAELGFIASATLSHEPQRSLEVGLPSILERRRQLTDLSLWPGLGIPILNNAPQLEDLVPPPSLGVCEEIYDIGGGGDYRDSPVCSQAQPAHPHHLTPPESDHIPHPQDHLMPTLQQFVLTPMPPSEIDAPIGRPVGDGEQAAPVMDSNDGEQAAVVSTYGEKFAPRPSEALWIADLVPDILLAIHPPASHAANSQIRVLTHALPLPSLEGYCFPKILIQVQALLTPQRTTWISHWHAVSGTYNIASLPTTPPSTPAPPHEGDDYFTTRVFDSAVSVPDYQQADLRPAAHDIFMRANHDAIPTFTSPRPAVPPSSVHVSITERYLPPASSSEFIDLFEPSSGRSLLSDRLVELSENNGILVFVYPTRNGGDTFLKEYLSPVLDPLLRRMMIVQDLGADVCQKIGSMNAVLELPGYHEMKARLEAFCKNITSSFTHNNPSLNKFRSTTGSPITLELVYSARKEVSLAPEVWSDWWCRQEKPRIRQAFDDNIRQKSGRTRGSIGLPVEILLPSRARVRDEAKSESSSMTQILEVIEGVQKGAREKAKEREARGIEVGVFIVRKRLTVQH